jgi:hypothetical protein
MYVGRRCRNPAGPRKKSAAYLVLNGLVGEVPPMGNSVDIDPPHLPR